MSLGLWNCNWTRCINAYFISMSGNDVYVRVHRRSKLNFLRNRSNIFWSLKEITLKNRDVTKAQLVVYKWIVCSETEKKYTLLQIRTFLLYVIKKTIKKIFLYCWRNVVKGRELEHINIISYDWAYSCFVAQQERMKQVRKKAYLV